MLEWLFGKKKVSTQALEMKNEDEERDIQKEKSKTTTAVGLAATESAQGSIRQAAQTFAKPQQYTGNRNLYDSGAAKRAAKMDAFQSGKPVYDPYTGDRLVLTKKEAIQQYGKDWQSHLAEADHVTPLERIHEQTKDNPWLTTEDIRRAANSKENLDVVSRKYNNPKRSCTNSEYVNKGIELTPEGKKRAIQRGQESQKALDHQFSTSSIKNAITTTHNAGMQGAKYGGITAATVSSINNLIAVVQGEKTAEEALSDTVKDSGQGAVTGYVMSGGLTFIGHQLSKLSNSSPFISNLAASNVPGNVITAVMMTGDVLVRYGQGEITTQELFASLGERGGNFVGSSGGMAVGQFLIPIPIVGGAIGSMIGGSVTSFLISNIRESLENAARERYDRLVQEMMKYYAEENRRKEVKKLIRVNTVRAAQKSLETIANSGVLKKLVRELKLTLEDEIQTRQIVADHLLAMLCLQEYRRELQEYINAYFADCEQCFSEAINIMDTALEMGDYENAMIEVNMITRLFGQKPVVEDTQDFIKRTFSDELIEF